MVCEVMTLCVIMHKMTPRWSILMVAMTTDGTFRLSWLS
jgi:hypothetical protein